MIEYNLINNFILIAVLFYNDKNRKRMITMKILNEEEMVNLSIEEREKYLGRIDVLDKVGKLLLLPNTELMTTKMVAEFYEVDTKVIQWHFNHHRDELVSNGVKFLKFAEIKEEILSNLNGELNYQLELTPKGMGLSPKGSNVFSKRAALNIGMLLRDSEVAKRVRTTLLDQQDVMTDEQKVVGLDDEEKLLFAIVKAKSPIDQAIAVSNLNNHKNRHIAELNSRIDEMKPKEEAYDSFIKAENGQKIGDVAKVLGIGRNSLIRILKDNKVFMKQWNAVVPYQKYIDSGHFFVKEYTHKGMNCATTYVTPKGVKTLNKLLKKLDFPREG